MLTLWLLSSFVQFDQLSVLNFLQIIQASTFQIVVKASCDTHETKRRNSSLLRWSHDCLWLAQSWKAGLLSCSDYNWRTYKCTAQHSDSFTQLLCQFSGDMLCTFFIQSLKVDRLSFIGCSQTECLNLRLLWWKAHELNRNVVQMFKSLILQSYSCTVSVLSSC